MGKSWLDLRKKVTSKRGNTLNGAHKNYSKRKLLLSSAFCELLEMVLGLEMMREENHMELDVVAGSLEHLEEATSTLSVLNDEMYLASSL